MEKDVELIIPKGTKRIHTEYRGRTDITRLIVSDGVEEIGYSAFRGCKNLKYVYLPKSVKKISPEAFEGCSSLEVLEGCKGVEYIYKAAFNGTALKSITLPSGVTLGERPGFEYGYCFLIDTLERIDILPAKDRGDIYSEDGVLFDSYYAYEKRLKIACFPSARKGSYAIPGDVKCVGGYAFYHSSLEQIIVPEGVKSISWHGFDGCKNLKRITFPTTLESIGSFSLANCPNLEEVIFTGTKLKVGESVFANSHKLKRVVIPDASNLDEDWLKDAPGMVRIETTNTLQVSEKEFLDALEEHGRGKSDIVIAGLRAGYGKGGITAENVKTALQSKNNLAYFQICADLLYEYGRFQQAFGYYLWHSENLSRMMDCAEKITLDIENLNRISMRLAQASGLAEEGKLVYSYMDSDFDENPYDPSHWTVTVKNYKYAFEVVKQAAKEGYELCARFLAIIPQEYESKIVNSETNSY